MRKGDLDNSANIAFAQNYFYAIEGNFDSITNRADLILIYKIY